MPKVSLHKIQSWLTTRFTDLRHFARRHRRVILITFGVIGLLLAVSLAFLFKDIPSPNKLTRQPAPVSTQILDRQGRLLYEIFTEKNRTPINIKDLPPHVYQATIAIEDKNFYRHFGLDLQGITRAAFRTLTGQRLEGGSTITQQLVKTALLNDPSRTITRKIKEAVLAIITEVIYSKDQILELYLNHAPYGGTAYGIETASHTFFNKPAKDLTISEAALLAGLPQAPTRFSPFGAHPELAKQRQHQVLNRMQEDGYISSEQYDQALAAPLSYAQKEASIKAPHFVFWVRDLLVDRYGEEAINLGGLRVTTTLDLDLQQAAQASLSAEINKLTRLKISNGAALVTRPKTGEVLSMVGSRNYFDTEHDGNVNVTLALRQPGSSIKPLNYAVGLLNGWTASTMFLDIPTCFRTNGQKDYCPKNYDNTFHGPVQMRLALGNSYNIPAVKQLALNGIEGMIATASAMGITGWTDPSQYGLSLTLGGGEVRMVDMAVAFGVFANGGVKVPLNPILKVETYQGQVLEETNLDDLSDITDSLKLDYETFQTTPPQNHDTQLLELPTTKEAVSSPYDRLLSRFRPQPSPKVQKPLLPAYQPVTVLPEEVAYIISHILLDNNARAGAFGTSSELVIPKKTVSVKTGTTNDLRDNWTIGYNPDLLTAVWVGNNDNSPMSYVASGVTGASPIWNDIMRYLLKNQPDHFPDQPAGVTTAQICSINGLLPTPEIPCDTRTEYYIKNHLPPTNIPARKQIWVRRDNKMPLLPGDNVIDLDLEEHTVYSDPFTSDFCFDCAYPQETKPDPADPSKQIPTGKIGYPTVYINYDTFRLNPPSPTKWIFSINPSPTPAP